MHPHGRIELQLHPECKDDARDAAEADDKEGRTIGRIGEAVVQPAMLAAGAQRQESVKEMSDAAARTEPPDPGLDRF
jgi:hypothetical protein